MLMEVVEHHECARPDPDANFYMAGTCRWDDVSEPTGWGVDPEAGPEPGCENGVYTPPSECGGTASDPCEDCWLNYCPFSTGAQQLVSYGIELLLCWGVVHRKYINETN